MSTIKRRRLNINQSGELGFTLIEVAVAVAILAVAFATLISLQTSIMHSYIGERNRFRAALYAQYLITQIELAKEPPEPGSKDSDLDSALDKAGYFENDSPSDHQELKGWSVNTAVESIDVLELTDMLRRVDLTVSWGDANDEQFHLVYFISNERSQNRRRSNG